MVKIKKIDLFNFRCYENDSFLFDDGINIIVGDNATGKTSLVEAVYLLGMCKSFRTSKDFDMIKEGQKFYCINGKVITQNEHDISVMCSIDGKKVSKDGEIYKSLSSYLGEMIIISFTPDDLKLIKGDPKHRRRFLDINLGQIDRIYLENLSNYNRVLKERNEFLKKNIFDKEPTINQKEMLDVFDNLLYKYGKTIINIRKNFIDKLNEYIKKNVLKISLDKEEGMIEYLPNVLEYEFKKTLNEKRNLDLITKTTNCGPHRDDFVVRINGKNAISYGSQGQQRTLALSIKIGLADFVSDKERDIIVVLDDVFGELDNNRQKDLIKLLGDEHQTFITTTDISQIDEKVLKKAKIIKL